MDGMEFKAKEDWSCVDMCPTEDQSADGNSGHDSSDLLGVEVKKFEKVF